MTHEEVSLESSRKGKPVFFPLDINKKYMDLTVPPVFTITERRSYKDEATKAKGRERTNKPGSLRTRLSSTNPLQSLLGLVVRISHFFIA